ncbi:MAG: choice-of-anchor Q domain-containing protein [Solirubrobacterales bacterium]
MKRSLVAGNDADAAVDAESEVGGGIFHLSSDPAQIVNTTLANNAAADLGGAYYTNGATTAMSHVTFSGNDAATGEHLFAGSTALVKLANSIVPSALGGDPCESPSDQIRSRGYNLFNLQDPQCPVKDTDEVVSDVGFDPDGLQDNGGFTSTIAIQKASEAVNLVPLAKCGVSNGEDQRGFERPAGNRCDAGAFERGANA